MGGVLGTALIARGNSHECGVATGIEVLYCGYEVMAKDNWKEEQQWLLTFDGWFGTVTMLIWVAAHISFAIYRCIKDLLDPSKTVCD